MRTPRPVRSTDEVSALPSWHDMRAVLAICVPIWAGLTLLIAGW